MFWGIQPRGDDVCSWAWSLNGGLLRPARRLARSCQAQQIHHRGWWSCRRRAITLEHTWLEEYNTKPQFHNAHTHKTRTDHRLKRP